MGLLDRLDAIDRRLGLRRPRRKPPNRRQRWLARHRFAAGLLYAVVLTIVWQLTDLLLDDRGTSLRTVLIQVVTGFLIGVLVATIVRRDCEAWDRRPEA